jgi:glucose-1-phosphate thymidylyltransferase
VKAVLLCAGFATRLHPLTRDFPKPLLPVAGRPLVEHLVLQMHATGRIDEIVVVTNGRFESHFADWIHDLGPRLPSVALELLSDGARTNETRLGAVHDLALAVERRGLSGPLLVAGGDNLFRFRLSDFLDDHAARPRNLILVYREPDLARRRRSGVAELAAEGRVLRMEEKPEHPAGEHCCPPLYVFTDEALHDLTRFASEERTADAPGSFVAWLAARRPVFGHEMRGRRLDVGDVETYRRADAWMTSADEP